LPIQSLDHKSVALTTTPPSCPQFHRGCLQGNNGKASSSSGAVQQRVAGEQETVDGPRTADVATDSGEFIAAANPAPQSLHQPPSTNTKCAGHAFIRPAWNNTG